MAERPPGWTQEYENKLIAAIELIGHTGSKSVQMRYSDDEAPTVWMAIAEFDAPHPLFKLKTYVVTAHLDQLRSVLMLAEKLIDGGTCMHCEKPSGLEPDSLETMPAGQTICWWQYDPELKKFRRGCEGS